MRLFATPGIPNKRTHKQKIFKCAYFYTLSLHNILSFTDFLPFQHKIWEQCQTTVNKIVK